MLRRVAPRTRAVFCRPLVLGDDGKDSRDNTPHTARWTMKAIVVTDKAAGTAGMKLVERPEPRAAINDVMVQVYASGFVGLS